MSSLFVSQKEDYECGLSRLFTAIDWDKKHRGVGWWNDPDEFYRVLLEKLELEMEVSDSSVLCAYEMGEL